MTPGDPGMPVDVLGEAAQWRVDEMSLRIAAGEIGVSYSGLRTFLKGTEPYAPTLAKLRAWYAQTVERRAMTSERARAMLAELVEGMPAERREEGVRELVMRLVESYRRSGVDVPGWLEKSARHDAAPAF